jgi:hypothetical protein
MFFAHLKGLELLFVLINSKSSESSSGSFLFFPASMSGLSVEGAHGLTLLSQFHSLMLAMNDISYWWAD